MSFERQLKTVAEVAECGFQWKVVAGKCASLVVVWGSSEMWVVVERARDATLMVASGLKRT